MVGAVAVGRRALAAAGLPPQPIVGFDMGGTSTDVFHFDDRCRSNAGSDLAWERSPATEIAGLELQAPMLPIHTVAAGGGSVLRFDGRRLQVGPVSAGADPGPAAYRRGGPLTITDANVLLGRLPLAALPAVFGPKGDQPADGEAVRRRFAELAGPAKRPPFSCCGPSPSSRGLSSSTAASSRPMARASSRAISGRRCGGPPWLGRISP